MQTENWDTNADKADFYFIKEKVEHILNRLGINRFKSSEGSGWGRSYSLTYSYKKKRLVCFGKVTKDLCSKFGVKSDVYMADFNWDLMLELAGYTKIKYQEVSKFPSVRRDLSLLIDKSVSFSELKKIATATDNKILKLVNLFDVYEGDKLPKGKKSYAISFIMSDESKTLTDKYVDKIMEKLMYSFKEKAGAELR
jgi:phenylalanyl-tRNA synthetase beta chain